MTQDGFSALQSHVHFLDIADPQADTYHLFKLWSLFDVLHGTFKAIYVPGMKFAVDLSLRVYRGRQHAFQINLTKFVTYFWHILNRETNTIHPTSLRTIRLCYLYQN